jgi:hypothetical protein
LLNLCSQDGSGKSGWLEIKGTHQLWVCSYDVNILRGSVHTVCRNTETLIFGSKVIGLDVNADKTKYMVMSRDQNAGRCHNIKIDNSSFERVEQFK